MEQVLLNTAKEKYNLKELRERIRTLVHAGHYRAKIHAVRHMIEEGFTEKDVVSVLAGDGKILESYEEDNRCLIYGYFIMEGDVRLPLHIICDYSNKKLIDVVTAYIPQKPWWITPTRRGLK